MRRRSSRRSTGAGARASVNSKRVKGIPVLSIDDGEKLGSVNRAYVDAGEKRVVGFAYSSGGGFLQVESELKLDTADIRSLGPDALMLDRKDGDTGASVSERYGQLLILDDIGSLPVMSESGISIGQMASLDFDHHSFALTQIEISPGYFKANQAIPIEQVVAIGRDYVIVDDAAMPAAAVAEATVLPSTDPASGAADAAPAS
jgi:uncharacterized protein YrrD